MTNEELVERLEWWLAYFNDETAGPHPDYVDNPAGFDESAIEPDLREATARLRAQDGERIVNYPADITTRWLEHISNAKHTSRVDGEESPIHNLTSVESILKWWEEEVRPLVLRSQTGDENAN